ncbi:hypothetical protein BJX70DRAFT_394569 [Aspergillus crustosus]
MASLTQIIPRSVPHRLYPNRRTTTWCLTSTPIRILGLAIRNPAFSTTAYRSSLNKPTSTSTSTTTSTSSKPDPTPSQSQTSNPELPKFSLESLGISRNVRIVLYTLLAIYGSFETYFYYQWIMRWWRGKNGLEE